ncbi:hypothetical protein PCASD_15157 [Puccinia coronata f. sp. avenae]|uniref:Cytoplasmic tRNA 2-thiolation protein 1 C-terminal domain-containing protein n=1 Tax=Puccinia coronata f. sp. avenae TaxID=200324 RepID=A0A2N5U9N6_9BASI|nr:hypothetical protein PCASD_15157 [Puccinia coronata f. sp. avenae]
MGAELLRPGGIFDFCLPGFTSPGGDALSLNRPAGSDLSSSRLETGPGASHAYRDAILIVSGVSMAGAVKTNVKRPTQQSCLRCGSLASQLLCQACALIDGLNAQTQKHGSALPKLHTNHESARNWYPVPLAAEFLVAKQAGLMISQGMSSPHNIRPL